MQHLFKITQSARVLLRSARAAVSRRFSVNQSQRANKRIILDRKMPFGSSSFGFTIFLIFLIFIFSNQIKSAFVSHGIELCTCRKQWKTNWSPFTKSTAPFCRSREATISRTPSFAQRVELFLVFLLFYPLVTGRRLRD